MSQKSPRCSAVSPRKTLLNLIRACRSPLKSPSKGGRKTPVMSPRGKADPSRRSDDLESSPSAASPYPPQDDLDTPTKETMRRENLVNSAIASAEASVAKIKLSEWEIVSEVEVKMLGDDLPHNVPNPAIEAMSTPTKQELSDEQEENLIQVAIAAATAKPKADDSGWEIMNAPSDQEELIVHEAVRQQSAKTRRKLAMKIAVTLMESGFQKFVQQVLNSGPNPLAPFLTGVSGQVLGQVILIVAEIVNEFLQQKGVKVDKLKNKKHREDQCE